MESLLPLIALFIVTDSFSEFTVVPSIRSVACIVDYGPLSSIILNLQPYDGMNNRFIFGDLFLELLRYHNSRGLFTSEPIALESNTGG